MSLRQVAGDVLGIGCATGLLHALGCMALMALGELGTWLAIAGLAAFLAWCWRVCSAGERGGGR